MRMRSKAKLSQPRLFQSTQGCLNEKDSAETTTRINRIKYNVKWSKKKEDSPPSISPASRVRLLSYLYHKKNFARIILSFNTFIRVCLIHLSFMYHQNKGQNMRNCYCLICIMLLCQMKTLSEIPLMMAWRSPS